MRKVVSILQGCLATINCFDEATLLIEVPCYDFLNNVVRIAALLGSRLSDLLFDLRSKVDFHALRLRKEHAAGKLFAGACSESA